MRVPGPEIVARPAGLLLELSGATIADLLTAKSGIEPMAARLLAEAGSVEAFDELDQTLEALIEQGWLDAAPEVSLDELFALLTKPELLRIFAGPGHASLRKAELLEQLRAAHHAPRTLSDWSFS